MAFVIERSDNVKIIQQFDISPFHNILGKTTLFLQASQNQRLYSPIILGVTASARLDAATLFFKLSSPPLWYFQTKPWAEHRNFGLERTQSTSNRCLLRNITPFYHNISRSSLLNQAAENSIPLQFMWAPSLHLQQSSCLVDYTFFLFLFFF